MFFFSLSLLAWSYSSLTCPHLTLACVIDATQMGADRPNPRYHKCNGHPCVVKATANGKFRAFVK